MDKGYTLKDFESNLRLAAEIARSQFIDDYDSDHFEYFFFNFMGEAFAKMIADYAIDHKIDLRKIDSYFDYPTEWR